jgi:hypothetical protein
LLEVEIHDFANSVISFVESQRLAAFASLELADFLNAAQVFTIGCQAEQQTLRWPNGAGTDCSNPTVGQAKPSGTKLKVPNVRTRTVARVESTVASGKIAN